jgi:hypothetical protein
LVTFHYLIARDIAFDDLEELNGISATANLAFFYSFVACWLAGLANSSVVLPTTDAELEHISTLCRVVGLPVGCTGSACCVHVFWDMCPAHIQSCCKGRRSFLLYYLKWWLLENVVCFWSPIWDR